MKKIRIFLKILICWFVVWAVMEVRFYIPKKVKAPSDIQPIEVEMKTTSYCHCQHCCSYFWALFVPLQKTGPFSWQFKRVGITASGVLAQPGTIAADTSIYPFGTVMYIDGYGWGRVEDRGGAIKGQHIDLYRSNHLYARKWGVQKKKVKIWLPKKTSDTVNTLRVE